MYSPLLMEYEEIVVNKQDNFGNTPLHIAVINNQIEIVNVLLENNAKANIPNNNGWTPLHTAAYLNSLNDYRSTPLKIAIMNNQIVIVNVLLDNNATADIPDNEGWTPLHIVAENGNTHIAKLLLDKEEGRISLQSKLFETGESPLYVAAQHDRSDIVSLFLNHSETDVNQANIYGNSSNKTQGFH